MSMSLLNNIMARLLLRPARVSFLLQFKLVMALAMSSELDEIILQLTFHISCRASKLYCRVILAILCERLKLNLLHCDLFAESLFLVDNFVSCFTSNIIFKRRLNNLQ